MSKIRREKHREKVLGEQIRKVFRRTLDTLESTQTGPWKPGPWWPQDHPKYRPEPGE